MLEILKHFIITEVVEIGIALLIGIREKNNIKIIFIVNLITNIILNFFLKYISMDVILHLSGNTGIDITIWFYVIVILFEIIILFIEGTVYFIKIKLNSKCIFYKMRNNIYIFLLMSFILNISSIIVGRFFE